MIVKTSCRRAYPALPCGLFLLFFLCLLCLTPALADTTTYIPDADWVINEDTTIDAQVLPGKDIVITIAEGATLTINGSLTNGYDYDVTVRGKGTLITHGHHDDHNIYGIWCKDLVLEEGVTVKAFGARSTDSGSHAVYANTITVHSGATLYAWGGNSSEGTGGNGIGFLQVYSPCSLTLEGTAILQASGGESSDGSYGAAVGSYAFFGSAPPLTLVNSMTGSAWTDIDGTQNELEIAASSGQTWSDLVGDVTYPLVEFGIHHHYFEVTHTDSTLTLHCKKCGTEYTASLSASSRVYDGNPAEATLTLSSDFTPEYTFGVMTWHEEDGTELDSAPVDAGSYIVKVPVGYLGEVQFYLSVPFEITQAVPTILTAPAAESLVAGECLADSVLSGGTADVAGVFSWEDPSIVPSISDSKVTPYTVIFTPENSNYSSVSTTVTVEITQAVPTILTAPSAESMVEGECLADSVLSGGTANVAGVFSWEDPSIVPATSDSGVTPYTVIFTPENSNYSSVSTTVTVLVIPESKETIHIEPVEEPVHVIHDHHNLSFETVGTPVENVLPLLTDITVDGHTLSEDEFIIVPEEVPVLVLNEEFLDTLSPGAHVLEEDFGTEIVATVVFEVKEEKVVPKTGDTARPLLWFGLILLSLTFFLLLRRT